MYGGSVISITTRERAQCALVESDSLVIRSSTLTAEINTLDDLALQGDELDIARASLRYFGIDPRNHRFSLSLSTDIPMRAGVAGSTALVGSIVGAIDHYLERHMDPWALAETARKIEAGGMGVLCGFQDQHMTVFGGVNYMDFAYKEELHQRPDEPLATVEPLASYLPRIPLIAAHTGVSHNSGVVHRSPRERWLAGDLEVIESYRQIAHLARQAKRALLAGDWPTLGAFMNENHAIVAALGGSGPENERLIGAATNAGAFGAKLAGAGGGGTILALVPDLDAAAGALLDAGADSLLFPEPGPGLLVTTERPDSQRTAPYGHFRGVGCVHGSHTAL